MQLDDWEWRLDHIYTFIDWNDEKCTFVMNEQQRYLFRNMHRHNIILKSRQFGISTFMCLFMFDAILFKKDIKCLLVAHTRSDAESLFANKIKYAYDNLPSEWKASFPIKKMTATEIVIDHGDGSESSIKVSTSGRSGTFKYIHVSELGKIAACDPMKAAELVSGTLNAGLNSIVTIESTAEGEVGVFHDMCIDAMENIGELTKIDYKFFFFGWFEHPLCTLDCPVDYEFKLQKYWDELGIEISRDRKYWYEKKSREQKDKMNQEFPSTPEEAFSRPLEGAYYGKQLREMKFGNRIGLVEWNIEHPVHTSCDIGHGDLTVNLYYQIIGRFVHIFDIYVGEGDDNDLESMCVDMDSKPYTYGVHLAPHDMGVFEWGMGCTRLEAALKEHGYRFQIADKKVSVADGIEAVKSLFKYFVVHKKTCSRLLSGLRSYRKGRHPDGSFTGKPNHDQSDFADPVRYLAVMMNVIDNEMLDGGGTSDEGAIY